VITEHREGAGLLTHHKAMATSEAPPSYSVQGQGAAVQPLVMVQGGAGGLPQGVTPVVMVSLLFRYVLVARPVCLVCLLGAGLLYT